MPARGQLTHRARYEPNPELIALDLSRNADAHDVLRFQERLRLTLRLPQIAKMIVGVLRQRIGYEYRRKRANILG